MPQSVQTACGVKVFANAPAGAPDVWPLPPVDLEAATRTAKDRLHSLRRTPEVRAGKAAIVEKHASRKVQAGRTRPTPQNRQASSAAGAQLSLGFD